MTTSTEPTKAPLAYQVITDRIIQKLEQGVVPWQLPWNARLQAPQKAADFILNRTAEQQGQIDAQEVSAA